MLFYAEFLTGSSSCRHALNVPPLDPSCKINIKRAGLVGWWAGAGGGVGTGADDYTEGQVYSPCWAVLI